MGWEVGVRRGESGFCARLTPVCARVHACAGAGAAESLRTYTYIHTHTYNKPPTCPHSDCH